MSMSDAGRTSRFDEALINDDGSPDFDFCPFARRHRPFHLGATRGEIETFRCGTVGREPAAIFTACRDFSLLFPIACTAWMPSRTASGHARAGMTRLQFWLAYGAFQNALRFSYRFQLAQGPGEATEVKLPRKDRRELCWCHRRFRGLSGNRASCQNRGIDPKRESGTAWQQRL